MGSPLSQARRFLAREDGITSFEYAVMLALITIGLIAVVTGIATTAGGMFSSVSSSIS